LTPILTLTLTLKPDPLSKSVSYEPKYLTQTYNGLKVPLFVAPGNHDVGDKPDGVCEKRRKTKTKDKKQKQKTKNKRQKQQTKDKNTHKRQKTGDKNQKQKTKDKRQIHLHVGVCL
jgi:hypothetical protein